MSCEDLSYWEVEPRNIELSKTEFEQVIPLVFRGNVSSPEYFSTNPDVAIVDGDNCLRAGLVDGRTLVGVWHDSEKNSLRYISVLVGCPCSQSSGVTTPTPVHVSGTVLNSDTSNSIAEGYVLVSDLSGNVVAESSILNGSYSVELNEGSYNITATADGFEDYSGTLLVSSSGVTGANINMQPTVSLSNSVAIITLEWDDPNIQLEAHLTGPRISGGAHFHVYHDYLEEPNEAKLMRTAGVRSQQIQIFRYNHDQYRFYVHNFTERYWNPAYGLGNSGARVTIQTSNGTQQFTVPSGTGNLWQMLEIDGNTGWVHSINALGYLTDPSVPGM